MYCSIGSDGKLDNACASCQIESSPVCKLAYSDAWWYGIWKIWLFIYTINCCVRAASLACGSAVLC